MDGFVARDASVDAALPDAAIPDAAVLDAAPTCDGGKCPSCAPGQVLVPGGTFMIGANDLANQGQGSAPVHRVTLSAFCLDRTEVTVAAYRGCINAAVCTAPDGALNSPFCNWPLAGHDHHPINCVDWMQAQAYCHFVGGRLPTEAQWEYAARHDDQRDYPWGDAPPNDQLCWKGDHMNRAGTCPVGATPAGDSRLGIQDMAGNVWEWVSDWLDVYPAAPVTDPAGPADSPLNAHPDRGGAWNVPGAPAVRAAYRDGSIPGRRTYTLGFRCAGDVR